MAYRDDAGHKLEAPTAAGMLRLEIGPRTLKIGVAARSLHVVEQTVTLFEHRRKDRRTSYRIAGGLVVARDVPHEDLGIWLALPGGMRRIFGVEPVSLLEPEGLPALAALDKLVHRLRAELADHTGEVRRAVEIGRGLDKVLLADHGDQFCIYARRLSATAPGSRLRSEEAGGDPRFKEPPRGQVRTNRSTSRGLHSLHHP